jgi:hypothetical protein
VNDDVTEWASKDPLRDRTPVVPPGTVTVYVVDGTKDASGVKSSSEGPTVCQVPATAGLSDGYGEPGANGSENLTAIVVSEATPVDPLEGATEVTTSGCGRAVERRTSPDLRPEGSGVPPASLEVDVACERLPAVPGTASGMATPAHVRRPTRTTIACIAPCLPCFG